MFVCVWCSTDARRDLMIFQSFHFRIPVVPFPRPMQNVTERGIMQILLWSISLCSFLEAHVALSQPRPLIRAPRSLIFVPVASFFFSFCFPCFLLPRPCLPRCFSSFAIRNKSSPSDNSPYSSFCGSRKKRRRVCFLHFPRVKQFTCVVLRLVFSTVACRRVRGIYEARCPSFLEIRAL